jgi:sucrose phosphorylase
MREKIEAEVAESESIRHRVYHGLVNLLKKRNTNPAFHPTSDQQVVRCHKSVFALLRSSIDGERQVLCLHNVSNQKHELQVDLHGLILTNFDTTFDILSERSFLVDGDKLDLTLQPYQTLWLQLG